jgi:DNA-binding transcriptional MerR regulator
MSKTKYALCHIETRKWMKIGSREVAALCNVHPDFIDRLVRLGLLEPTDRNDRQNEWGFEEDSVLLVKKIVRLREDLGINYAGIGVVLELLARIESLENRIQELTRDRM